MKSKKIIFLFLALLLPSCIFIFLKMFGDNQFDVAVLFADSIPEEITAGCNRAYSLPYHIPDSTIENLQFGTDSLVFVSFGDTENQPALERATERYKNDPVSWRTYDGENDAIIRKCIFIMEEPFDVALVDRKGAIRGQYDFSKRDEVDRFITEIAILIRKY